ncbi:MAG: hypothetical protein JWO33_2481 [Caulobacteraceae bacterium]|nr:hypothetical protein [Caulobacteraceae bacterium]
MSHESDTPQPLSAILGDLIDHPHARISVEELSERFGGRALGALLFVFAVACTLPLPPGATTIFGMPLLLLAPQLVWGSRAPWLPVAIRKRSLAIADLRKGLPRVIHWLQRVEAISRPRLTFLFGPVGDRVIGLVCTLLAFVLILPIPLGNMLPAAAVAVLSFSLAQRDGILALLGYGLAITSVSILALAFRIIVATLQQVIMFFAAS